MAPAAPLCPSCGAPIDPALREALELRVLLLANCRECGQRLKTVGGTPPAPQRRSA